MKRLIAAVVIALFTVPAFADAGAPFEQTQFDRDYLGTSEHVLLAQIGGMSYKSGTGESESVWLADHNFIAPPQ